MSVALVFVAALPPLILGAIITTCSNDTSPWSTCVRTETDGVVFFPRAKAGAWSQHFYEAKYRVLSLVERNETSNAVPLEEATFQNCITESITDTPDWYEQVEMCQSVTDPDVRFRPVIRVPKRAMVHPVTQTTIPYGAVQVVYNITWPVEEDEDPREARFVMTTDLRYTTPQTLWDLFYLGVNTFPQDAHVARIGEWTDAAGRTSVTSVNVDLLFNMSWQVLYDHGATGGTTVGSLVSSTAELLERRTISAFGKGVSVHTAFRFTTEWKNVSSVMVFDPWVVMSTGVLTSGSLNLFVVVSGCITAVVIPVACCLLVSVQRCRLCPLYRWLAARNYRTAPNRQTPMTRAEKKAYRALHGPFPEDPPTREVIQSTKKAIKL